MTQDAAVDDDPLWRLRWALLASMIVMLAAVGLIVAMHHTHWNWALFIWGIAIGLAGRAIIAGVFRFVTRHHEPTPAQRIRLQRRRRIYTFCWLAAGLICGSPPRRSTKHGSTSQSPPTSSSPSLQAAS